MKFETRTITSPLGVREESEGPVLTGYAATFSEPYCMGPFHEQIDRNAFARSLGSGPDVRLLIDHEGQPLARTKSGTLTLSTDDTGLAVRAALDPADPDVQRLIPKMRRGDLDQMSFSFRVMPGGERWSDDLALRTLTAVEIHGGDVSVVTFPANLATSASVRAADERTAKLAWVDAVVGQIRQQRALAPANLQKLQEVLAGLAMVDEALDAAEQGLDDALAGMSAALGLPNPDPADEVEANSARPLGLALAVARRLGL